MDDGLFDRIAGELSGPIRQLRRFLYSSACAGRGCAAPRSAGADSWALAALFILSAMAVNLRGARDVGQSSKLGAGFVLGAFALMVITWLVRGPSPHAVLGIVTRDLALNNPSALLLGMS